MCFRALVAGVFDQRVESIEAIGLQIAFGKQTVSLLHRGDTHGRRTRRQRRHRETWATRRSQVRFFDGLVGARRSGHDSGYEKNLGGYSHLRGGGYSFVRRETSTTHRDVRSLSSRTEEKQEEGSANIAEVQVNASVYSFEYSHCRKSLFAAHE